MSGIVGIVGLDGRPVDRELLRRMTAFMAFRGPDAQETWSDGPVGFGHTLLRSTDESQLERQPFSVDGRVWITADARVDDQPELRRKLEGRGRTNPGPATDVELILRAYETWGEDCVHHLVGDFAFAIWDGPRRRLFCVRDHFGVKPFYYAQLADGLVFSNTLNCVRRHPDISGELNDQAIVDFLLFDFNQDPSTTAFQAIQRLPPAHSLTWSNGEVRLKRYWTLPANGSIRYQRPSEYVDHFKELLRAAVRDRLRTDRVGVLMSGGLDSTTIAATAKEAFVKESKPFDLRAFTLVYDHLVPDSERYYSNKAATALGIPIHHLPVDDYRPFDRCDEGELPPPEPVNAPLAAIDVDQLRHAADHGRVVLTGYGPDSMLAYPMRTHIAACLRELRLDRIVADLAQYVVAHGWSCPRALISSLKRRIERRTRRPTYPSWLETRFAASANLPGRWAQTSDEQPSVRTSRRRSHQDLSGPYWAWMFEKWDPGVTGVAIDVRHPFFDRRLAEFFLAIPPIPWCLNKRLIRLGAKGLLPEAIRRRRKVPLSRDPLPLALRRNAEPWAPDHVNVAPQLRRYIAGDRLPPLTGFEDSAELWSRTRPLSLSLWLQRLSGNASEPLWRNHANTGGETNGATVHSSSARYLW
jgi:asparagine synthase (glutamine-hydrolysing)